MDSRARKATPRPGEQEEQAAQDLGGSDRFSFTDELFSDEASSMNLETLSDDELEDLLFEADKDEGSTGIWNLPTVAGLSLIVVGIAYMFQQMGIWSGLDLSVLANMLPWLAGVLIILLGFGVLSWRPKRKKKKHKRRVRKGIEVPSGEEKVVVDPAVPRARKKRLTKSRNKKISGVCAGLAEYFNLDPTLIRIAFVIGIIATGGPFFLAYIALAFIMPKPETPPAEERIRIIRDR